MKVLMLKPNEKAKVTEIENELSAMQKIVGGYIETYPLDKNTVVICDEEGKLKNKAFNRFIAGNTFVGDLFICGTKRVNFCGLTEEQIDKYKDI